MKFLRIHASIHGLLQLLTGICMRCALARRGRRCPLRAHGVAVGPSCRLRCGARPGVAPHNSLRSLRSLRSDKCGESVHEARLRAPTPVLCSSPPHSEPAAGSAWREGSGWVFGTKAAHLAAKPRADRPQRACEAPRNAGPLAARDSAHRHLTRCSCLNGANAVSAVSSATGQWPEYHREVGAQRRPSRRSAVACPHAAWPRPLPHLGHFHKLRATPSTKWQPT